LPGGGENQAAAIAVGAFLFLVAVDAAEWFQAGVVVGHDTKVGPRSTTIGVTDIDRLAQIAERSIDIVARILVDIAELAIITVALVVTSTAETVSITAYVTERTIAALSAARHAFEELTADFSKRTLLVFRAFAHFNTVTGRRITKQILGTIKIGVTAHTLATTSIRSAVFVGFANFVNGTQTQAGAPITAVTRRAISILQAISSKLLILLDAARSLDDQAYANQS